uniref:Alpha-2,8-sialyltransferase 8F n=2 Tax=Petromyzon marinus TaxID=7757 RepID=A0AAJ7SY49_PETMA|nr:alpha-2,8-sialyltransferase 8F [Petromyzon marinus]
MVRVASRGGPRRALRFVCCAGAALLVLLLHLAPRARPTRGREVLGRAHVGTGAPAGARKDRALAAVTSANVTAATAAALCRDAVAVPHDRERAQQLAAAARLLGECRWEWSEEAARDLRAMLRSCCDARTGLVLTRGDAAERPGLAFEAATKTLHVTPQLLSVLPESSPLAGELHGRCAVVGNSGALLGSRCGRSIDNADFVIRCNLPPVSGNFTRDVGNRSHMVTLNPSIIKERYGGLHSSESRSRFVSDVTDYGDALLLVPALAYVHNLLPALRAHRALEAAGARQKAVFFHPDYLRRLARLWAARGLRPQRLSTGLMLASASLTLCRQVHLYGFWPLERGPDGASLPHHYFDDRPPRPGAHDMPQEFSHYLLLHSQGAIRLHMGACT